METSCLSYRPAKLAQSICLLILPAITSLCVAQVNISNIRIVSENYSSKSLTALIEYDGSFGHRLNLGVTALTSEAVRGSGYRPAAAFQGTNTVSFTVERPAVRSQNSITSDRLQFQFYWGANNTDFTRVQSFNLDWDSLENRYPPVRGLEHFTSIERFTLDEAIPAAGSLFPRLLDRGVSSSQISVFDTSSTPPNYTGLVVRIAEGVSYEDLMALFSIFDELALTVAEIGFIGIGDPLYNAGMVRITKSSPTVGTRLDENAHSALLAATSLSEIYQLAEFEPSSIDDSIEALLAEAIRANDMPFARVSDARRAQQLASEILELDPDNIRAYVEFARAEIKLPNGPGRYQTALETIERALILAPQNPYALHYAGFLKMEMESYGEALAYFRAAQDNVRDASAHVWNTTHWAILLGFMGDFDGSVAKFQELLNFETRELDGRNTRAHFYGVQAYISALESIRSTDIDELYELQLEDRSIRAKCVSLDYAMYILRTSDDFERAKATLNRTNSGDCAGIELVTAVINIVDWRANAGTRADLYRHLLNISDNALLAYQLGGLDGGSEYIRLLRENSVDVDADGAEGYSALVLAIADNNMFVLQSLIESGAELDRFNAEGTNPLFQAIVNENVEAVLRLLKAGADVRAENEFGGTALLVAEAMGNKAVLRLIQDALTNSSNV